MIASSLSHHSRTFPLFFPTWAAHFSIRPHGLGGAGSAFWTEVSSNQVHGFLQVMQEDPSQWKAMEAKRVWSIKFQYNLETNFKEKRQIMLSFAWPHRSFCSGSFLISSHASSSSSCTSCSDSDSLGIPCEEILRSKISRPAICFPCFEQVRTVETELILGFEGDLIPNINYM